MTHELYPAWSMWEQFITDMQGRALQLDALRSSHPIQVPIKRAEEVEQVFDAISYCKGGSVVRMVHAVVGEEAWGGVGASPAPGSIDSLMFINACDVFDLLGSNTLKSCLYYDGLRSHAADL